MGDRAASASFNTLAFFVTDAADVGGKFSIKVGDTLFSDLAGADGKLRTATSSSCGSCSPRRSTSLTVELMHDRTNDGFGIDGAAVALAPIPLPPAALLLLTGIAGLAGLGRVGRGGRRTRGLIRVCPGVPRPARPAFSQFPTPPCRRARAPRTRGC